jgi:hypothetical protein
MVRLIVSVRFEVGFGSALVWLVLGVGVRYILGSCI